MARPWIVCVDDEPTVLAALADLLRQRFGERYEIATFGSGGEALAALETLARDGRPVALVLADLEMPTMQGDALLAEVSRLHPSARRVLLTGSGGLDAVVRAVGRGGLDRYIDKPWEPENLLLSVEGLLAEHRLAHALATERDLLERKSTRLAALQRVGVALASSFDIDAIAKDLAVAIRELLGREDVEVLYGGAAEINATPRWWPREPFPGGLTPAGREALLELHRSTPPGALAAAPRSVVDDRRIVVPLERPERRMGLVVLGAEPPLAEEDRDILSLLALQAATALRNVELTQERIVSERLSAFGRVIGSLVHDLRSPLTAIRGYASMLGAELDEPVRREYSRLTIEECDRLNRMIDELLEFARGGHAPLRPRVVSVGALLAAVARRAAAADPTVRIETRADYDGPARLDPDRLGRALTNLTTNALQAMEPGGRLVLASRRRDDRLLLDVVDDGKGIPPEIRHRIFEPFFSYGKAEGVGLGMSIARRIVEEHGGRIEIESRPGRGTTVRIDLPLRVGDAEEETDEGDAATEAAQDVRTQAPRL